MIDMLSFIIVTYDPSTQYSLIISLNKLVTEQFYNNDIWIVNRLLANGLNSNFQTFDKTMSVNLRKLQCILQPIHKYGDPIQIFYSANEIQTFNFVVN